MDSLVSYSLPVSGLHDGVHTFTYKVGKEFFQEFEDSAIQDAVLKVVLQLDKRPSLFILDFQIAGTVQTECDRCLQLMDLPIEDEHQLMIKFDGSNPREEADVIYLEPGIKNLQVAKYVYEFIHLSLPISKYCEMGKGECNEEILDILDGYSDPEPEEGTDDTSNSPWEELKKLSDQK